jgi:hypothetical protein
LTGFRRWSGRPGGTKPSSGGGGEGLPLGANARVREIQRYFGLDACAQTCFSARGPETPKAPSHGAGILKNAAEYREIKKTLFQDPSSFYDKEYLDWLKATRDEGNTVHWFTVEGFFWYPRELLGIEAHLYSFYDAPELLGELCQDYAAWLKQVFEYIGNVFQFDFMSFAEDMSYNHGPMLGKRSL